MGKISKLSIFISFLSLWIVSYLKTDAENIIGFFLIFSFGILHGANDLVIINHLKIKKEQKFVQILISYIVLVLFAAVIFIIIPSLALLLFIVVSAYHFGEQHWQELINSKPKWLTFFFKFNYGMVILFLLFYFHEQEVQIIIQAITSYKIELKLISSFLIIQIITLAVLFLYFSLKSLNFKQNCIIELFLFVMISILFKIGSLIWGFTIYFIFWHSIPSLYDQITFLYGKYSFSNFILYFKSAFIYWLISLLGIVILYYFFKDKKIFDAIFFSFLAAITFPHAWVISKMFKKKA
ncbi:Brp/Blh family beta-carotene 15,15'-dioxygenase [Flavobacterium sp. SUN052]|uniref:Brp/Blh family beta-carotene 15,15'-dioxygenase n=1 Tax=Flavobacterium sp. SUN052 TaxID=3002441 RepID=UPI00237DAB53|nr:Brp/Blh family beta-carotene 15,15'-dioxygenase [Flavobacterium sp. SUN052]MEC4005848.1 Brp/Blh family beta-carotene 15,15'-dioxygenase [Flavobacterium sp. SUN052]